MANFRTAIAKDGAPDVTLTRQSGGYRLDAGQDQVDLHRFRRLLAEPAAAAGDDRRAGVLLTGALELWRGSALAGLDSPWLNGMREALELQRRTAVLDLGDIALRKGSHRPLAVSLAEEAVHCPTDERLIGQLMLAPYRCGQQAEALQWFEQTCAAAAQARRLARKHRGPRRNRPTAQLPAPAPRPRNPVSLRRWSSSPRRPGRSGPPRPAPCHRTRSQRSVTAGHARQQH